MYMGSLCPGVWLDAPVLGTSSQVLSMLKWRNWQTPQAQNLVSLRGRGSSTLPLSTGEIVECWAAQPAGVEGRLLGITFLPS